jgi:hypothetical protein
MPEPQSLDDAALTNKLYVVIDRLAQMSVFITSTDHLSDRELYSRLWNSALREEVPEAAYDDGGVSCLDLIIDGSEASARQYMKYYATERDRLDWLERFPDSVLPPHEELPYDRDRHLPKPFEPLRSGD